MLDKVKHGNKINTRRVPFNFASSTQLYFLSKYILLLNSKLQTSNLIPVQVPTCQMKVQQRQLRPSSIKMILRRFNLYPQPGYVNITLNPWYHSRVNMQNRSSGMLRVVEIVLMSPISIQTIVSKVLRKLAFQQANYNSWPLYNSNIQGVEIKATVAVNLKCWT